MTRLLINENPLQVLPTLAVKIGLNEAMILQQMHYWLNADHNKNYIQGRHWVYNSYDEWHKQFPFWSKETIKRAIYSLEKQKLVISDKLSEEKFNHRKWYSIDYSELQRLDQENERSGQFVTNEVVTNEKPDQVKMTQTDVSMCSEHKREQRLPTEITAEISSSRDVDEKKSIAIAMKNIWVEEIKDTEISHLPESLISTMFMSYKSIFANSLENWRSYCRTIASSKFLMGEGKSNFKVLLGWAIKPEVYCEIKGGKYTLGDREILLSSTQQKVEENNTKQEIINSGKHPLWIAVCQNMLTRGENQAVKQWLLELDIAHYSQNEVYIYSPNRFVRDWVNKNLSDQIRQSLESIIGSEVQHISIDIYKKNNFGAPHASEKEEEGKTPPTHLSSSTPYLRSNTCQLTRVSS